MGVYIGGPIIISDMQGPAPDGYHVPLTTEWQAIYNIRTALGGGSSDGTNFGKALKLPCAGVRNEYAGAAKSQGSEARYWSSSRYDASNAYNLDLSISATRGDTLNPQNAYYRSLGGSVRCFKNSPVVPTSSWTKLYGTSIEAGGIFWSSADGLISLSNDGQTWITIQDKNLGATQVWNSGDTLSEANCGKYYQWGNNYGFAWTGSVTTSSTQVDASAYGPGNYYSSSTFITRNSSPYRWDTTDNGNLRGGVSQGSSEGIVMSEMKNAYIGEVWTPNANTLLYLPLESDTIDYSGNNRTCTPTSVTYTTVGGVPSAHVGTSGKIALPVGFISASESKATVSFLYYVGSATTSNRRCFMEFRNIYTTCSILIDANATNIIGGYVWDQLSVTNIAQKRNHIVITGDINGINMYMNGNLVSTMAGSATPRRNSTQTDYNIQYVMSGRDANQGVNGNMREYILEKTKRSAEDVSKYYQRIKAKLGI